MFKKTYLKFLCCPNCRGGLSFKKSTLVCQSCKKKFALNNGIPVLFSSSMSQKVKLSQKKWEDEYQKTIENQDFKKLKKEIEKTDLDFTLSYLKEISLNSSVARRRSNFKNKVYLEIGCGSFLMGQELAKMGAFVVGIDFSLASLKLAQLFLKEKKIKNYLLICGDITKMPLKNNKIDLLYGGGVIEHFQDTQVVVAEIYRILKKGGNAFNTVPLLNLSSLTYRQLWGNIPNFPILKQIAELIHIKLLKTKYMKYGYELSFTQSQMRKIFIKAGFKKEKIETGNFKEPLVFEYFKFAFLKRLANFLASNIEFFWPVMYIKARK